MITPLPLENIRVIEMSHMIMGPSCGMMLAQLGAEVIKIEPPKGDKTRGLKGMGTAFFPLFNRGKRSIVLDLTQTKDRATFDALLATADVFVENFRDGQLEKQGINVETLREKYPELIIAGHKGFLSGPYEHRPALDEVVQMMTGLAMMTGSLEQPKRVGSSANDIMGGMFGVIGILAALFERQKTGQGKDIRIGLFENCLCMVAQHMVQYDMTAVPSVPMPDRVHAWPIYDIFNTRDAQKIFIGVVTDGHWLSFCQTYDLATFLDDPRLQNATDRIDARAWTVPIVAEKMSNQDIADLEATLDRLNIPFSRINRPEDMFEDLHVLRDGGLVTATDVDGKKFRAPALPIELNGQSLGADLIVPKLGQHTADVLAELGVPKGAGGD
jgi:crotonobetainyl-CoA:carnitine CoA-transferase CaiB-like acyl-CoA transferase